MVTVADLLQAARESAEADEKLALRYTDPRSWQQHHYHASRAQAARRLIADLHALQAEEQANQAKAQKRSSS